MLLGQVKAKIPYRYIFHISKSQESRAFYRSSEKSKEVLWPHNPYAGHRWANNRGSQWVSYASDEGSHLRGRTLFLLCLYATQLATLATDSSWVKGDPETSESTQTLLFQSYHSLDRYHGAKFCGTWLQTLSRSTDTHGAATSGKQILTQGPQTDLWRVYKPQHLNLLLEKWSKAFIRFSKVSVIQKRLHPLSEKGNNTKSLNNELLGTHKKLNSELLRYRPYLHHCISCT